MSESHDGWIGVDFDGTLAVYHKWEGATATGEPIAPMVERVRKWLAEGRNVRIVTARVYAPGNNARRQREAAESTIAIQNWCLVQFGKFLPVTCVKDFAMIELWDDRCIQVEQNTGDRIKIVDKRQRSDVGA